MKNLHDIGPRRSTLSQEWFNRLDGYFVQPDANSTSAAYDRIREEIVLGPRRAPQAPIISELYRRANALRYQVRNVEGLALTITREERDQLMHSYYQTDYFRTDGEGRDRFMGIPIVTL